MTLGQDHSLRPTKLSMPVVEGLSGALSQDLLHEHRNETHLAMRLTTGVGVIIAMSGSWVGDFSAPTVRRTRILSIS